MSTEDATLPDGRLAVEEAQGLSLLRQAQRERDDDARVTDLYLDVPMWSGDLVAQYAVVDRGELEKMARAALAAARTDKGSAQRTDSDMNLILKANVGLHMRDHDKDPGKSGIEDLVPITDDIGVVTYARVGPPLGREFKNSHDALGYVFSQKMEGQLVRNDVAISTHALQIARWMQDPSKPVQDVAGF